MNVQQNKGQNQKATTTVSIRSPAIKTLSQIQAQINSQIKTNNTPDNQVNDFKISKLLEEANKIIKIIRSNVYNDEAYKNAKDLLSAVVGYSTVQTQKTRCNKIIENLGTLQAKSKKLKQQQLKTKDVADQLQAQMTGSQYLK